MSARAFRRALAVKSCALESRHMLCAESSLNDVAARLPPIRFFVARALDYPAEQRPTADGSASGRITPRC
jgi:hypothetical protein